MNAVAHNLRTVAWTYFCTLTFRVNPPPSNNAATKAWFAFIRRLAQYSRCSAHSLTWALRREAGEVGGRLHLHGLVRIPGGSPIATPDFVARIWSRQLRFGISEVRYFDPSLDGVGYVLKGGSVQGANQYEGGKFDQAVTLSTRWDTCPDTRLTSLNSVRNLPY